MSKRKRRDILWKGIIEDFFEEFLNFFFPEIISQIDFSKSFQFLDKEVAEIFPDDDPDYPKVVDKLVKVYLTSGQEQWFLVHIEVQGYREVDFPKRMFRYFYRLYDKFDSKVASLAIFLGKRTPANASPFIYEFNSTQVTFDYKRYYIGDQQEDILERSTNVFALIIHTALIGLKKLEDEELFRFKYKLVRKLYDNNLPPQKIRKCLTFLGAYLRFENQETAAKFVELTENLTTKNTSMGIIEQVREMDRKEGEEIGEKRGQKIGEKNALYRVAKKMLSEGLEIYSIHKFTGISVAELKKLNKPAL